MIQPVRFDLRQRGGLVERTPLPYLRRPCGEEGRRRTRWLELVTPGFLDCRIVGQDEEVELRIARCLSRS